MQQRAGVILTDSERGHRTALIAAASAPARTLRHARIRRTADQRPRGPCGRDAAIAAAGAVSQPTVARVAHPQSSGSRPAGSGRSDAAHGSGEWARARHGGRRGSGGRVTTADARIKRTRRSPSLHV